MWRKLFSAKEDNRVGGDTEQAENTSDLQQDVLSCIDRSTADIVRQYVQNGELILPDSIQSIEGSPFDGLGLKKLVIPDGAYVSHSALSGLNCLAEPVYNKSRTVLYYYPSNAPEAEYIVPDGVEVIEYAAIFNHNIERIVFPASLKVIKPRAIKGCIKLKEAVFGSTDTVVETEGFYYCEQVEAKAARELRYDEKRRMLGQPFLSPVYLDKFVSPHRFDPIFLAISHECGKGNADSMWALANYFAVSCAVSEFSALAANFWRYRAALYGNKSACEWVEKWISKHPDRQPNAIMPEFPNGHYTGKLLRSVGFLFFSDKREYTVTAPSADGIAEACTLREVDRVGFDDYEYYYDHYLLDEFYAPINRLPPIQNISSKDRHDSGVEKIFRKSHAQATEIISEEIKNGKRKNYRKF